MAIQDIIFILDESGSMQTMGEEPVQAVNAFIKEQQKTLGGDGATFSLWKFNSTVTKLIDDQPLQSVTTFTDYRPNSMTALLDAIGQAISTKKNKEKYDDVICVILTDGQENSSREYTTATIKQMTTDMEKNHNWKFIYLGANQDSFAVGNTFGISASRCANYECSSGQLLSATHNTSAAISSYRMSSKINSNSDLKL